MNISAAFQFIPLMASDEKIFEYFFVNLAFLKFRGLGKNYI